MHIDCALKEVVSTCVLDYNDLLCLDVGLLLAVCGGIHSYLYIWCR